MPTSLQKKKINANMCF